MGLLVRAVDRIQRRIERLFAPVVVALVSLTARVLRRGRYRPWRREAERLARRSEVA